MNSLVNTLLNVPSVVNAGTGLAGMIASIVQNEKNLSFQKETNDSNRLWIEQQNNITRNREDNAYQRAVVDAENAGLSPLAISGGAQASSPMQYMANASQMDLSGLIGAMTSSADLFMRQEELNERKREFNAEHRQKNDFRMMEHQEITDRLSHQINVDDADLKFRIDSFNASLKQERDLAQESIEQAERFKEYDSIQELSLKSAESYKLLCDVSGIPFETRTYTDYDEYLRARDSWDSKYTIALDSLNTFADSYSENKSDSVSAGFNAGQNASDSLGFNNAESNARSTRADGFRSRMNSFGRSIANAFGMNIGANAAASKSRGNSADITRSNSLKMRAEAAEKAGAYPVFNASKYNAKK